MVFNCSRLSFIAEIFLPFLTLNTNLNNVFITLTIFLITSLSLTGQVSRPFSIEPHIKVEYIYLLLQNANRVWLKKVINIWFTSIHSLFYVKYYQLRHHLLLVFMFLGSIEIYQWHDIGYANCIQSSLVFFVSLFYWNSIKFITTQILKLNSIV